MGKRPGRIQDSGFRIQSSAFRDDDAGGFRCRLGFPSSQTVAGVLHLWTIYPLCIVVMINGSRAAAKKAVRFGMLVR
jgi:hypothetical protein